MLKFKKLKKLRRVSKSEYLLQKKLSEPAIPGEKGDDYVLTEVDKIDISALVPIADPLPPLPAIIPVQAKNGKPGIRGKKGEPGKNAKGKSGDQGKPGKSIKGKKGDDGDPGQDLLWESLTNTDKQLICQKIAEIVNIENKDVDHLRLQFNKNTQDLRLFFEKNELSKVKLPYQKIKYDPETKILTISEPDKKNVEILLFFGGGGSGKVVDSTGHIFVIPVNQILTIPVDRQFDHFGRFCVNGRKVINGRFVLGIGANV